MYTAFHPVTAGIVSLEENGCVGLQFDLNYAAKLFAVVKEMARICVQTCIKTMSMQNCHTSVFSPWKIHQLYL